MIFQILNCIVLYFIILYCIVFLLVTCRQVTYEICGEPSTECSSGQLHQCRLMDGWDQCYSCTSKRPIVMEINTAMRSAIMAHNEKVVQHKAQCIPSSQQIEYPGLINWQSSHRLNFVTKSGGGDDLHI